MIFESPLGLLALSAIALVSILHRLRQRPERRDISSLFIWKQIEQYLTASPVRKKSRSYLILFLQILLVIFLSLALAKPVWRTTQPEPLHLVFLIDNSASMGSIYNDSSQKPITRWELLLNTIGKIIEETPNESEFSFYQQPEIDLVLRNLKHKDALNTISKLELLEIPSDIESLVQETKGIKGEFYFCSDKLPPESVLNRFTKKPHLILVGTSYDNEAIIRASATPTQGKEEYYDIFVSVKNYSSKPSDNISIDLINNLEIRLGHQEVNLGANQKKDVFFKDIHLPERPVLKISNHPRFIDDLECDNEVVLLPPQPCRIKIFGKNNPALAKVLNAIPSISLNDPSEGNDISVFNETIPVSLPAKSIIINSIPAGKTFWDYQGKTTNPVVTGIDTSSPVLKYCDPNVFNSISSAVKLLPVEKEYLKPIIQAKGSDGEDCVLFGEWQKGEQQIIILNFPLEWRSETNPVDWTLTPSFPIFWTNLIHYFHPLSKDYALGSGLCNEEESDNNGISVMDTAQPPADKAIKKEIRRIDFTHWSIFTAGILLLLSWMLGRISL